MKSGSIDVFDPTTTNRLVFLVPTTPERLQLGIDKCKAYYRRALAHSLHHEEDEAEADLHEALKIVPGDDAITKELAKVQQKKREKREKEKKAFKGLFS
ncbi:unnamed protein product [Rhizoctonia solani]|uniref:Uncharacterized protein n=1 Tax=Rhizoctonia solani TaxID=456999 RepID=A0A8H3HGY1_9AGAM|nr:unnamed protein product [Rhizoctonia solani]